MSALVDFRQTRREPAVPARRPRLAVLTERPGAETLSSLPEGTSLLDLSNSGGEVDAPADLRRISPADVSDAEEIRREFLEFVDRWPRQPLLLGRSFDDLFRHVTGDSVWWTGPGLDRHAAKGAFARFRRLRILSRALNAEGVTELLAFTSDPVTAHAIETLCAARGVDYRPLPGSARPADPEAGRLAWAVRSLKTACFAPAARVIRAAASRLTPPAVRRPAGPVIVFSAMNSDYVREEAGRVEVRFWREVAEALRAAAPGAAHRYVIRHGSRFFERHGGGVGSSGRRKLGALRDRAPSRGRHAGVVSWMRALPRQVRAVVAYARLEGRPEFRASFRFDGIDLRGSFVPKLRTSVAGLCKWAADVDAAKRALAEAGDVRAVVLAEEMYRPAQVELAAARSLAIPTIGVQHGTIMPSHLVYRVPSGQVAGAPLPDRFAVYGEYAREVVSGLGAYPRDRVVVTGGARFDRAAEAAGDRAAAREALGLPHDRKVVLVAGQTFSWFPAAVRTVLDLAGRHGDWLVCVKPHPKRSGPSAASYEAMARDLGVTNCRVVGGPIERYLAACDVLVSGSSATVLEAALLGRAAVCVNFSDEPDWYPYVADGAALPGRDGEELRRSLERVLSDGPDPELEARRGRFLERHAGPAASGTAAETLARLVVRIAGLGTNPVGGVGDTEAGSAVVGEGRADV